MKIRIYLSSIVIPAQKRAEIPVLVGLTSHCEVVRRRARYGKGDARLSSNDPKLRRAQTLAASAARSSGGMWSLAATF